MEVENSERKRTRVNDDDGERETKRVRAMISQRIKEFEAEIEDAAFIAAGRKIDITTPKTYAGAIGDPESIAEWEETINEEIRSLETNGTWTEIIAPREINLVSTKWVFTIKTNADGTLERFKARLAAKGFPQTYGEDYTDTFAPTVRMDTLRIFLAMVAAEDYKCRPYDIEDAFTEASLRKHIFLSEPDGIPVNPGRVLRIFQSLYGLKQSARDQNLLID